MRLNCGSQANDASGALDKVVDESESEQSSEERSRYQGYRVMDKERKRSKQGEETPESCKSKPSGALGCGNRLNVPVIKSLVPFDQNQLFD
jgi:hypothetical protein